MYNVHLRFHDKSSITVRVFTVKIFNRDINEKSIWSVQYKKDKLIICKIHFSMISYIKWILQFMGVIYFLYKHKYGNCR